MERVTGIGGVFFRAKDPEALSRWYADYLGITPPPPTYDDPIWWQKQGPTVWGVFSADTDFLEQNVHGWMVNFRVADLDAILTQLRQAGTPIEVDEESYPNGRFAYATDPEGNRFQLWEPNAATLRELEAES